MRNFMQTLFRIDTKMMQNFVQIGHFVQKRETVAHCFVETLLWTLPPWEGGSQDHESLNYYCDF